MAITMRYSFREAVLATFDKECADLRRDLEGAVLRGQLDGDDPWEGRIVVLPQALRDLDA